jgi:molybdopterin-guanine dinucleotide biosynthesis protein A
VIACDCPWLSPEVIEFIFLRARGHDGALLRWPNGFIEPLQAVYRTRSLLKAVKRARGKGINKLGDVVNSMEDIVYISPEDLERIDPELKSFRNINSPEDVYKYDH